MAAVYPPEFLLQPKTSTTSSTAPKVPKLRDSCDACAAAKVRCTKKKPTCTRCDKRGITCEYIATKRAGRPSHTSAQSTTKVTKTSHDSRRSDTLHEVHISLPPSPCKTAQSELAMLASPGLMESSPMVQQTTTCQDALPNLLASDDPSIAPSSLASFSAELDNFFASLGSFSALENPTHDLFSLPSFVDPLSNLMDSSDAGALISEDSVSIATDSCSDLHILPNPHTLTSGRSSITGHVEPVPALSADSPCCCLITALGFLKELFPNTSNTCVQPGEQTSGGAERPFPTIQSMIAENEQMVEAMDGILQCSCSQDVYLLTVLSLVVFKVLDRYAAAARSAPTVTTTADSYNKLDLSSPSHMQRHPSPQYTGSSSCVDGEDSSRVAAQMVLSELHRAQRLVNNLSARFKVHRIGAPNSTSADALEISPEKDGTWPFSTTMLDQLEADLRRRLRTVSSKIVDMIRRY